MKRILFFLAIAMAWVCTLQAAKVNETEARQVANNFFMVKSARMKASAGAQSALRLAYTADQERFYIFDRGSNGGFVVVAGDDRLPQVLAYGEAGNFSAPNLPTNVQYWVDEMNRQIQYLQSHDGVLAHKPAQRVSEVQPLLTTRWDQSSPYNDMCPTYDSGNGGMVHAVTGCVATAMAQIMNYYEWPDVGRGSHSYWCRVNGGVRTQLSADFSQSVYRWDLMLDTYYANSDPESCEAVAKLMSDVGISVDMGYGSSSGAQETDALNALKEYFKYTNKAYMLHRDYYGAEQWDQIMFDEITAQRPVLYCGFSEGVSGYEGHAFVLDGFDTDGYFHVNWGWGGSYDGYFLVSVLAPMSGTDFKMGQDGIFGLVPDYRGDEIEDVRYMSSQLIPMTSTVALGDTAKLSLEGLLIEGNNMDTVGYETIYNRRFYYTELDLTLGVFDSEGVKCLSEDYSLEYLLTDWFSQGGEMQIRLPESLKEGEYKIKINYSSSAGSAYVKDYGGQELYVKMTVRDGVAHLSDCFLYNSYSIDSFVVPRGITTGEPFTVGVELSYKSPWIENDGPVGNVYLSILKDGEEVAVSEMYEVMIPKQSAFTYEMQIMAPEEWGFYDLVLKDESGNCLVQLDEWHSYVADGITSITVLPPCHEKLEDFETMTANNSTNDKGVQGQFTSWDFTKCGVRAPGEELCHGTNAVMMKKPSIITSTVPVSGDFFMAQATFFNPTSTLSKYKLEYSVDGAKTWSVVYNLNGRDAIEVPANSQLLATWTLRLTAAQHALFRITMFGGGSSATYLDDFCLYYTDPLCDVNKDGEINIADVNSLVDAIFSESGQMPTALDVNKDGEINIADVNAVIDMILSR